MKYIIMCGGKVSQFETPRQLFKINGETLVERTIRLLREFGITDIAVSTNDNIDSFNFLDVPIIKLKNSYIFDTYNKFQGYWCDGFYETDEPVCYIMGDVYFSKAALKQIIDTETDDILFFGTDAPYPAGYPKRYQEPLAFKVVNQKKFIEACKLFRQLQDLGEAHWPFCRKPISWELAQIISNQPLGAIIVHTPIFVGIHHFASDIDDYHDIATLENAVKRFNID